MATAAIVGGGSIGTVHARAYRNAGVEVVAVVDPSAESAERFVAEVPGAVVHPDLPSLLASAQRPDMLSIASPPFAHRELVAAAAAAGVPVLCEKPMAHTLDDAIAIDAIGRGAPAAVGTAYCHRFQPEIEFIRRSIDDGLIGRVRSFSNEFAAQQDDIEQRWFGRKSLAGGGVLIDTAIHSIDLFRFLCGEVAGVAGEFAVDLDGVRLEVDHTAAIALRSADSVIGSIECSWKSPAGRAFVRVAGSEGSLLFDYFAPGVVRHVAADGVATDLEVVDTGDRFDRQLAAFAAAVADGRDTRTGTWDGLVGVAVVDAVTGGRPFDLDALIAGRSS